MFNGSDASINIKNTKIKNIDTDGYNFTLGIPICIMSTNFQYGRIPYVMRLNDYYIIYLMHYSDGKVENGTGTVYVYYI